MNDMQDITDESRADETRASETRASETRASETRASETRAGETRADEGRADEARVGETQAGEAQSDGPVQGAAPISELLAAAAEAALPVVRAVREDQLGRPTPCAEYDVRALLNHLFHVVVSFQALAAKKDADFSRTPDRLGEYGAAWPDRFADETARLVEAWAAPGAEDGLSGGMQLPARVVGAMVLLDLTVHAWDTARATGQPYAPPAGCVAELRALIARMAPTARQMNVFAEPLPVPPGAPELHVLLAEAGRDPHWSAG